MTEQNMTTSQLKTILINFWVDVGGYQERKLTTMNVLSLCDGMSCAQIALEMTGIKVDKYFASEIKPHAIKATKTNFPNTIHIGDVNNVSYSDGVLHTPDNDYEVEFDLVCFGSPCQSFSRAMWTEKRIGLEDEVRSGLFLQCKRVLDEVKPKYFLLENVIMKPEDDYFLTQAMGVEPIRINSSIVTGQNRDRLYWTNIPYEPIEAKGVKPSDILDADKGGYIFNFPTRCLIANDSHGYYDGSNISRYSVFRRVCGTGFGNIVLESEEQAEEYEKLFASGVTDPDAYSGLRFFSKYERARLQGCPTKYAECMTEKEAADLFGDGWTCSVISHIFKGMLSGKTQTIKQMTFDDLFI